VFVLHGKVASNKQLNSSVPNFMKILLVVSETKSEDRHEFHFELSFYALCIKEH